MFCVVGYLAKAVHDKRMMRCLREIRQSAAHNKWVRDGFDGRGDEWCLCVCECCGWHTLEDPFRMSELAWSSGI